MKRSPFPALYLAAALLVPLSSNAQTINTAYGQNRLQHERYKWMRYESPNFFFSFTEDNESMLHFAVPIAEQSYFELKNLLEYQVKKPIEVVVYSDFSDYDQSNIGNGNPALSSSGITRVMENKILIYFDGDHHRLHCQIREGIARVLVNRMLFGSSLQEVVQNSVLMRLPPWFTEGIIAFASEEWNSELDDQLREAFLSGKYRNFLELAKDKPRLAGHSLFHFIARQYSNSHVSNLLYLTRINRSVESGFTYVFGSSFYAIAGANWFNYFSERYNDDNQNRRFPNKGELTLRRHPHLTIQQVKLNPNGKQVAYVERIYDKHWIVLHDIERDERKVIASGGLRNLVTDYETNYPLLTWSKNGDQLFVVKEKNDKIVLHRYNQKGIGQGNTLKLKGVERIVSVDASDGSTLVVSGLQGGHSDLYYCDVQSGELRSITQDKYDDLSPIAMKFGGSRGIVFASNRPRPMLNLPRMDSILPTAPLDLYFYNIETKQVQQLTHTELADEKTPTPMGEAIGYLSDENGIFNRYVVQMEDVLVRYDQQVLFKNGTSVVLPKDSVLSDMSQVDSIVLQPVYVRQPQHSGNTDYSRNILEQHSNKKQMADLIFREGKYHLFIRDWQIEREMRPRATQYRLLMDPAVQQPPKRGGTGNSKEIRMNGQTQNKPNNPVSEETDRMIARELQLVEEESKLDTLPPQQPLSDTSKIDIDNYLFQSEFEDVKKPTVQQVNPDTLEPAPIILVEGEGGKIETTPGKTRKRDPGRFDFSKTLFKPVLYNSSDKKPYKSIFKVEDLTFQLDNSPLFGNMDMYLGGNYPFPPLGLLFKTSFMDLYENFRLEIGARLPTNFNGMEYFINVENRKSIVDQTYSIYRRSRLDDVYLVDTNSGYNVVVKARNVRHVAQVDLRYPLNKFQALRLIPSIQADRLAVIAEDVPSLTVPVYSETRLGLRFEYIFDNTIDIRLNAQKGTAFKFYADFYQPMNIQTQDKFKVDFSGGYTLALGLDARQYFALDNKAIFALRFAGATSLGPQKMLYSLGGVENWILPRYSNNIPLPDGNDFAYQVLAANVRGFRNNIRNGGSYAVLNAELRIPIMEYLSRTPSRNVFLRNLQAVAFLDAGTAWQGLNPFDPDNPLNTTIVDPNQDPNTVSPVIVKVNYYRKPVVMGFGFGLRSVILGYYVRLDYAWGFETGKVQTPMLHLSLGTDF